MNRIDPDARLAFIADTLTPTAIGAIIAIDAAGTAHVSEVPAAALVVLRRVGLAFVDWPRVVLTVDGRGVARVLRARSVKKT